MKINAGQIIGAIIAVVISLILIANLLPIGLTEWFNYDNWMVNTTTSVFNATDGGSTIQTFFFDLVPLFLAIAILMVYIGLVRYRQD